MRSRHYVEVIDGEEVPDATGDLGRVLRQQQFLKAVFSELGSVKNPITLARAAGSAAGGLRIDDTLSLWDAIQFAWRLRSLDPAPVELPTRLGSNEAGSVLFLEPERRRRPRPVPLARRSRRGTRRSSVALTLAHTATPGREAAASAGGRRR